MRSSQDTNPAPRPHDCLTLVLKIHHNSYQPNQQYCGVPIVLLCSVGSLPAATSVVSSAMRWPSSSIIEVRSKRSVLEISAARYNLHKHYISSEYILHRRLTHTQTAHPLPSLTWPQLLSSVCHRLTTLTGEATHNIFLRLL